MGFSPHNVRKHDAHTHIHISPLPRFHPPWFTPEMYSCCQVLCALNTTQRQPNVVISGWCKNKKTCSKRDVSKGLWTITQDKLQRAQRTCLLCVCSQCAYVSPMSPKSKKFCVEWWLWVEALYIFYFIMIIFLASDLGGKSWLGWIRNRVLTFWCLRCCCDWRAAHGNPLAHNEATKVVFMFASGTCALLAECQCLVIDCFDMWGPLQQTSCCAFFEMLIGEYKPNSTQCVLAVTTMLLDEL